MVQVWLKVLQGWVLGAAAAQVLVLGAAGGVGIAAVQLGKLMGARVIACASSDAKLETCRQHGADDVINYLKDDLRKAVKRLTDDRGVDVILDPVGGEHAESAVRSMAWDGRYLVVGFAGGAIPRIPTNLALLKGCAMVGVAWDTYSRRNPAGGENNISELLSLINTGKLKPLISKIYSLTDAALAIDDVMQRRAQGKVIVVPG